MLIPLAIGAVAAWIASSDEEDTPKEYTPEVFLGPEKIILLKVPNFNPIWEIEYSDLLRVAIQNDTENKDLDYGWPSKIVAAIEAMANSTPEDRVILLMRGGLVIYLPEAPFLTEDLNNPNIKSKLNKCKFAPDPADSLDDLIGRLSCEDEDISNLKYEDFNALFEILQGAVDDFNISFSYLDRFFRDASSIKPDGLLLRGTFENTYIIINTSVIYKYLEGINAALQKLVLNRDPKLQSRLSDFLSNNRDMIDLSQALWELCGKDELEPPQRNEYEEIIRNTQTLFSFSNHGIEAYHCATMIVPEVGHEASLTRLKGGGLIDKDAELGRPEKEKYRKIIVCTDQQRISRNEKLSEILCTYVEDLVEYNASVSPDLRLKFEPGHPQNGVVYVQHPLRKNVYFDVDSFHSAMLIEKYEELKHLFQCLGARKISATVTHEDNVATSEKRTRSVKSDNNFVKAGVHGNVNWQGSAAAERKRYTKLRSEVKFNIVGTPSIPEDLIFYPHESTWQRFAKGALKSIYKEYDIKLEYRQDYAVNRQKMLDIAAKVQVFIPSFELNISTSFESDLRCITSTIWKYKVEFGNATSAEGFSRCEQIFLKRARRYAKNDGRSVAEKREDLVKLAETLGIDAIRREELIEEAEEAVE